MNFQDWPLLSPIKIMMINPLVPASQMAIVKILSGTIFGKHQLIDMILLVYSNEIPSAEANIQELKGCNFACINTIVATSDLPSVTDADVFCCMTNFNNPNQLDFDNLDTDDQFDTFYLYIKVARSLGKSEAEEDEKLVPAEPKPKPLIIGDGVVVLDILKTMGNENIACDFFCPAGGLPSIVVSTLGEILKVSCCDINLPHVWGADDHNFHIEVERPCIIGDKINEKCNGDSEVVSKEILESLKSDLTQINASWMKKEFLSKINQTAKKNPYGPIYKAWEMKRTLTKVWSPRISGNKLCYSFGTISNGALGTVKGLPYFFPLVFSKDGAWEVDDRFSELSHLQQEIKRFNKIAKRNHEKLTKYCKKFLDEHIVNQLFARADEESETTYNSSLTGSNLCLE